MDTLFTLDEVKEYIDTNILHSETFDSSDEKKQQKAVNDAWNTLTDYIDEGEIMLRDVAEQVIFIYKLDSTMQRADLGVNFVTVDGVQISVGSGERTLAEGVKRRHNISTSKRRKVGRYITDLDHTFRYGNGG